MVMSKVDLANKILNVSKFSQITDEPKTDVITGVAKGDSKDGYVLVDLGGDTISPDESQYVEYPTTADIRDGDQVYVTLSGAKNTPRAALVTGAAGGGDRTKQEIEKYNHDLTQIVQDEATKRQTAITQAADSITTNLSTIIREDSSGVTVGKSTDGGKTYSGSRSTLGSSGLTIKDKSGTQLASFGSTAAIGKPSQTHVNVDSDSLDILSGSNATLATFSASEVDVGKNSKTAQIKLAGDSVIFGRYGTGNAYTSIDSVDGVYIMAPYNMPLALASYHTNNNGAKVLDDTGIGVLNDKVSIKGTSEISSANLTINGHKVNPYGSTITMASEWTNRDSQVRVSGYVVNIWLNVTHAVNPGPGSLIATIPSSLAPAVEQDFAGTAWTENTPDRAWVTVTTSGQIKLKQYYGGGTFQIKCAMTYVMKG